MECFLLDRQTTLNANGPSKGMDIYFMYAESFCKHDIEWGIDGTGVGVVGRGGGGGGLKIKF